MSFLLDLITFLLILTVIVTIHEFGHFMVAKHFGVYCGEFSIGFGPVIYQHKGKETTFSIRALPLGGYVSMAGETDQTYPDVPKEKTLQAKKPWQRILIMVAGVVLNILLAFVLYIGIFQATGVEASGPIVVRSIQENSAAQQAGIQVDDILESVDFADGPTIQIESVSQMLTQLQLYPGEAVFTIERSGETIELPVTPTKVDYDGQQIYMLGITTEAATVRKLSFLASISEAWKYMGETVQTMLVLIGRLIRGKLLDSVSGPIGIFTVTSQARKLGIMPLVSLTALISLNLGVFNLLPIPALDGGRIFLTVVEWIIRRPLDKKLESALIGSTYVLLLGLIILISFSDVLKLVQ